jgi:elongation of very long chain fatty acids protein 6
MSDKPPFQLRGALALWSGALAIFSIVCTIRVMPEFYDSIFNHSFEFSVCNIRFQRDAPTALWLHLYSWAKLIELGDTVFIILRKQKLIFLHWYHHTTVFMYSYYGLVDYLGVVRYFCVVNMFVHSLMYSYYALRAMRVKVPRWVNIVITFLQIVQMGVGLFTNIMAVVYQNRGHDCPLKHDLFVYTMLMYASYLVLFSHFFYEAYLKSSPKHKAS